MSTSGLVLYVKAGADGQRYGACPFCQRVFMVLLIKSIHSTRKMNFRVVPVHVVRLPEELRKRGLRKIPALIDEDEGFDNPEDIIAYLDQKFPDDVLKYDNPAADIAVKDIFSRFCFYIKAVSKDSGLLENELKRLDDFLSRQGQRFLCGPRLCHLDCELLPKLQHLRVACEKLKNYRVPLKFDNVWRYLHNAYSDDIFIKTCPSNQEIVLHWVDRPETSKLDYEEHKQLIQETPRYSLDVPVSAKLVTIE